MYISLHFQDKIGFHDDFIYTLILLTTEGKILFHERLILIFKGRRSKCLSLLTVHIFSLQMS